MLETVVDSGTYNMLVAVSLISAIFQLIV